MAILLKENATALQENGAKKDGVLSLLQQLVAGSHQFVFLPAGGV